MQCLHSIGDPVYACLISLPSSIQFSNPKSGFPVASAERSHQTFWSWSSCLEAFPMQAEFWVIQRTGPSSPLEVGASSFLGSPPHSPCAWSPLKLFLLAFLAHKCAGFHLHFSHLHLNCKRSSSQRHCLPTADGVALGVFAQPLCVAAPQS